MDVQVESAIKTWGNGGIEHKGMLVVATAPFTIYRAHGNAAKPGTGPCGTGGAGKRGGWWAFVDPKSTKNYASKAAYRKAVGVCLSWNSFSHVVSCAAPRAARRARARRKLRIPEV